MKFIKFWWKHSLREVLITIAIFTLYTWISGYVHWWMYIHATKENHWDAASATFLSFWIMFPLICSAVIIFVVLPIIRYFASLIREYKDAQP